MKVLDRYLIREFIGPWLIGIAGFILILTTDLVFTLTDLIINRGIPLGAVTKLLIYKIPALLILTYPVATLFGAAMTMTRLSNDNELIAMRTSGIPFRRIVVPLMIVGIAISFLSFLTNEFVVPHANFVSENLIRQIFLKSPTPAIKEQVFFKGHHNRYFYIQKVYAREPILEGVMIYEFDEGPYPRIITASRATYAKKVWNLEKGTIHNFLSSGMLSYAATFETLSVTVADDPIYFTEQKTSQEMNARELRELIQVQGKSGGSIQRLLTDFYLKFSVPLTCLIFAMIGIPLAVPMPRTGRAWGIVVTIGIIFTFFVVASVLRSFGYGGLLPPLIAATLGHIAFGVLGFLLIIRENKKS